MHMSLGPWTWRTGRRGRGIVLGYLITLRPLIASSGPWSQNLVDFGSGW